MPVPMNPGLEYWTADEVAECLDFGPPHLPDDHAANELYCDLWNIVNDATNPTPLGGDGTDGTVETPDGRLDLDNDDKAGHWWHRLTDEQQQAINDAYAAEHPDMAEAA